MEDAHIAVARLPRWRDTAVFGVLDGHGGEQVARFVERHFPEELVSHHPEDLQTAFVKSFQQMDKMLTDTRNIVELRSLTLSPSLEGPIVHPDFVGCTALVCCVRPEAITVANAGDCRAVLSREGKAIELTQDHKPNLPSELERIRRAGGCVVEQRCPHGSLYRVNGDLSLSRAIGDLRYKQNSVLPPQDQLITCTPDVLTYARQPNDEFMVIACDGVWDVVSSQQAVDFIRRRLGNLLDGSLKPEAVAESLLDACLSPDLQQTGGLGGDNMSLIIVVFASDQGLSPRTGYPHQPPAEPVGWQLPGGWPSAAGIPFPQPFDVLGGG